MHIRTLIGTVLLALLAPQTAAAQLPDTKVLTLDAAKQMVAAAEAVADENDWDVVITIVDGGGHLLYFERMDGVRTAINDIALRKARAAASYGRPTKVFADRGATSLPGAIAIEGGLPVIVDGRVIGAIGVSGVRSEQDGIIAQAGVEALASLVGDALQRVSQ